MIFEMADYGGEMAVTSQNPLSKHRASKNGSLLQDHLTSEVLIATNLKKKTNLVCRVLDK